MYTVYLLQFKIKKIFTKKYITYANPRYINYLYHSIILKIISSILCHILLIPTYYYCVTYTMHKIA